MKKLLFAVTLAASFVVSLGLIFIAVITACAKLDPQWGGLSATMFFVPVLAFIVNGIAHKLRSEFQHVLNNPKMKKIILNIITICFITSALMGLIAIIWELYSTTLPFIATGGTLFFVSLFGFIIFMITDFEETINRKH